MKIKLKTLNTTAINYDIHLLLYSIILNYWIFIILVVVQSELQCFT